MKKLIVSILALSLALGISGCAGTATVVEPSPTAAIPNPVHEVSSSELLEITGISFALPEGAFDPVYSYIDGENGDSPMAQLCYSLDEDSCTVRCLPTAVSGDELPDISGLNYTWTESATDTIAHCPAYLHWNEGEVGYVSWYDAAPGLLYCFSIEGKAGKDALLSLAEASCPSSQGDSDTVGDGTALDNMSAPPVDTSFFPESKLPVTLDLNGDRVNETISIKIDGEENFGNHILILTDSAGTEHRFDTFIQFNSTVCLADIDADGCYELFFYGDCGSDDYISYAWRWDGKTLSPIQFSGERRHSADGGPTDYVDGSIETFNPLENGGMTISIGSFTYMLGTYSSVRSYTLDSSGIITPLENSNWSFVNNSTWLETSAELGCTLIDESTGQPGSAFTIPIGSKLLLTGTDGYSKAFFRLSDGKEGYFQINYDSETYSLFVDGNAENEVFVSLPYAG